MKTTAYILMILASSLIILSCEKIKGKGDVTTETRSVENYSEIDLSMDATVIYTQDSVYALSVEAQGNLMSYIQTFVESNRLTIRIKPKTILGSHQPIIIRITAPSVSGLAISGSGNIEVPGHWTGQMVETSVSGSGNINIKEVDAATLIARISGSGNISGASGYADHEDFAISGSGTIDLRNVASINCIAVISGSGNIYTQVSSSLDATISGSGSIYYAGQPSINVKISGSGKVIKL